ncbi:MAG TPA: PKD domain-containing protein, partial [Planctomycetaceae bacterium]|nr:PKD domain-containing protein [Planctomycetaceae bacterium]
TMTLSAPGGTFNGNPFPATGTMAGDVVGVDDTPGPTLEGVAPTFVYYTGTALNGTPSSTPPTDAGNYTAEENFIGSQDYRTVVEDQPFRILQATPTVTASDAGGTYNGNPFPATAKVAGVGGGTVDGTFGFVYFMGSTPTGTPSANAPTLPGTYTVVASFLSNDPNYASDTQSLPVTFTIGPVPPTIAAPTTASVNQNGSLAFTGTNAISVTDVGGTAEQFSLSVSHGTLSLTATPGVTITNNGTGSVGVTGQISDVNLALATLTYTPGSGYSGPDKLSLSDTDTSDSLTGTASVAITVNAVSTPPSVTAPATASLAENASLVFSSANHNAISVADATAGSSIEQLTLVVTHGTIKLASTTGLTFVTGSNNSASMTIKGTLANLNADLNGLTFTPTVGFFGPASLTVTFTDLVSNQTASATVAITVTAPASNVTVSIKTPLPFAVPFEPVPFLIVASDTNATAQAAPYTLNFNWGDGHTESLSSKSPLLWAHIFTRSGTYTVTVTATDEFGHTSAPATVTIRVLFVFIGFNPFNIHQTALFVGGTGGNDTVSFTTASGGIAVTLNGVAQGVFNTGGPLIVFTGGATDTVTKGAGVTASLYVAQNPTDYNLQADLEAEAYSGVNFNPVGFNAAMEILAS